MNGAPFVEMILLNSSFATSISVWCYHFTWVIDAVAVHYKPGSILCCFLIVCVEDKRAVYNVLCPCLGHVALAYEFDCLGALHSVVHAVHCLTKLV
jgi:hypothetical protein